MDVRIILDDMRNTSAGSRSDVREILAAQK